jgi:small subunit ribosomal protein S1
MPLAKQNNGTILAQLLKNEPSVISLLKPGDLVSGTVLEESANRLLVDLGRHGTGAVYRGELLNAREVVRGLKSGDPIHAKVVTVDNEDGYTELSITEASKQKAWAEVAELKEKDEPFPVTISGCNKGGLTASLAGLVAFLPVSQLIAEHYPKIEGDDKTQIGKALQKLVGTELSVKLLEANPRTGKLIISEREATEVSVRELVKAYTVGQVVDGIISGVADFGAFMKFTDNPAIEGLIHVSELEWRIVENPKEVVKVDAPVRAKITDIKDGKVSLSLKALKEDPWLSLGERYKEGQEVSGTVYSFNPFGALVNLDADIQGQIHVTAFGGVEEMKKELVLGKQYEFTVESVRSEERRITLKLKK